MASPPGPAPDPDPRRAPAAGDDAEQRLPHPDPPHARDEHHQDDAEPDELWDRHDARRQADQMAPPEERCECYCLHCGRTFCSDGMWFQRVVGDPDGFEGFWMCPTPNCSGAGFTFDIFPTDPNHPANDGWHSFDDDEDGYDDDEEWSEHWEEGSAGEKEYDPDEKKWKALDEHLEGLESHEDLEGEEWKYGLQPGERPESQMSPEARRQWEDAQREWEEEQQSYDEPDRRPRELDWSDRQDRRRRPGPKGGAGNDGGASFSEDDIPF